MSGSDSHILYPGQEGTKECPINLAAADIMLTVIIVESSIMGRPTLFFIMV